MLLRKQNVRCESCKAILHNIPLYLHHFRIDILDNPLAFEKDEILRGNLVWHCPVCNYINSESTKAYLGEDDYIAIIASKYEGHTTEKVGYVQ